MEEVEVHTVLQEFHEGFMGVLTEGFIRLPICLGLRNIL